jgi:histidinol dehydrogenase
VPLRIITDLDEARRTILRRASPEDVPTTPEMLDTNERVWGERIGPAEVVDRILARVERDGDAAIRDITEQIDGARLEHFEVGRSEVEDAYRAVPDEVVSALRLAAEQVRSFHERHKPRSWLDFAEGGATGQMITPIERVGLHAPGGRAAYPSTVVMSAVPARVAGCGTVVMCTPPRRDGTAHPTMLVAADVAGVDRVFKIGGAQAIGAMAYGTDSVPRVDKIVGPGNVFVALAKRRVYGTVGIDSIAGPTETMLIADETADPGAAAADLIAQAEHDPLASAILLATTAAVASRVRSEVERQLARLEGANGTGREAETATASAGTAVARVSLAERGGIVVTGTLRVAVELANEYAPEHLCLLVRDPWALLGGVRNAGGVFLGEHSLEAVGDYTAGPSHVMPTGGTARFSSPLTTNDFVKITSVFAVGREGIDRLGPPAVVLARAEGLAGHAAAVEHRLERIPRG